MKLRIATAFASLVLTLPAAFAQTAAPAAAPAPTPEHTFAYNVALSSQYIYRGLSQSNARIRLLRRRVGLEHYVAARFRYVFGPRRN
jgi:hypothetical protein